MKNQIKYICFLFITLAIFFSKEFNCQQLNKESILTVANNFIKNKLIADNRLNKYNFISSLESITEVKSKPKSETVGFIVNLSPTGFLIISNNRRLSPIIAYSFNQNWDIDTSSSNTLLQILKTDLSSRLENIDQISDDSRIKNNKVWEYYLTGSNLGRLNQDFQQWPEPGTTMTGGWIETTWHQAEPYNQFCPIDPSTGERSVIGCGALAVAQIVNYHKYFNNKRFSLEDKYEINSSINIDADSTNFDFPSFVELNRRLDTLQNNYDYDLPLKERDYAALCFAAGIMTVNEYSSYESPTVSSELYKALVNDMSYSAEVTSGNYSFYSTLIDNMKNGLPAELSISNQLGGHAAVCDGYNTDNFFHINFGWGVENSPTAITDCWYNLQQGLPYNYNLFSAIINIKPGIDENSLVIVPDTLIQFEPTLLNTNSDVEVVKLRNEGNTGILIEELIIPNNFKASLDGSQYSNRINHIKINPKSELPLYIYCKPDSIGRFDGEIEITLIHKNMRRYKEIDLLGYGGPETGTLIIENFVSGIWNATDSPYLIIDNTSVEPGENLTIQPGTTVQLLNNCEFTIGENAQFIASGTETDSISFTSLKPLKGCNGLQFVNSADDDTIRYCSFNRMGTESVSGGALYINSTNLIIDNSRFGNNVAQNGGAVYIKDSSPNISSSKFIMNNADFGGSIYLIGSNSNIEITLFDGNKAGSGGAIYMRDSSPFMHELNISNNSAAGFGGAIYIRSSSPILLDLEIKENISADLGGAIYFIEATPTIRFTNFFNNTAINSGGIFYSKDSDFTFKNCILDSNKAGEVGSIFSSTNSSILAQNITAINHEGNEFDDLFSINNNNRIVIKNSIIWDRENVENVSKSIPKVKHNSLTAIRTDTVKFYYNNIDSLLIHELNKRNPNIVLMGKNYNISMDPQFKNIYDKDFRLLDSSPCIDSGDPNDDILDEQFPHGYCINQGVYGGTIDAALTIDSVLTVSPNPIDFGELSSIFTKEITISIKNGTLYDLEIVDIYLEDSSNFKIAEPSFSVNHKIISGCIDSLKIKFTPPDIGEGIFETKLTMRTTSSIKDIPIFAQLYEGMVIGGNLNGVLTKENSPYTVNEEIIVRETLIIEPGVHLRFEENCGIKVESDGKFIAEGNENDSIKFSPRNLTHGWNGIEINSSGDDDKFNFCIFEGAMYNWPNSTAALSVSSSNPSIINCLFSKNQSYSCFLEYIDDQFVISKCRFENNYSGNIYSRYCSVVVENTIFSNNFSECISFHGHYTGNDKLRLINITASGNYLNWYLFYFSYYLPNQDSTQVFIENSILERNLDESGSFIRTASANISIEYSNIDTTSNDWFISRSFPNQPTGTLFWGKGNNVTDPMFVDAENGDLILGEDSPCIDAGNPNYIYNDIEDPFNSGYALYPGMGTIRNDMGAYGGGAYSNVTTVKEIKSEDEIPDSYSLSQNYPNPFNPSTKINFGIPKAGMVSLIIYNILGEEVAQLVNRLLKAGHHEVSFNSVNYSSGIYFYRLAAENFVQTKKMVVLK